MHPLVFLDIDGVLVTQTELAQPMRALPGHRARFHAFHPAAVTALNLITDLTPARIVISSTWRIGRTLMQLRELLADQGVTGKVIGTTGRDPDGIRGREIQAFLDEHGLAPDECVILDDDADMEDLMPRLIQTSFETGLTPEDARAATDLLTGKRASGIVRAPWGEALGEWA